MLSLSRMRVYAATLRYGLGGAVQKRAFVQEGRSQEGGLFFYCRGIDVLSRSLTLIGLIPFVFVLSDDNQRRHPCAEKSTSQTNPFPALTVLLATSSTAAVVALVVQLCTAAVCAGNCAAVLCF